MADVNGESFGGRWRCNLSYWTSQSNTSVSVGGTCQMQSLGYGMSLSGFYAHVDVNGSVNSTENTSFYSPTGGWVTKDMISHSQSFTRTHSDYSIYINACVDRRSASYYPGKSIPTAYITIPAKDHWTVSYDANGGSGAPSSQTKWRDETLTLSSTKPSRTGYSFQGWATSATGSSSYQPGASYTSNSALTLYAVWKANTWTVKFDANGGSGAPANQTKTYGVDLTLSTTKPTRSLYNFLGWGTSSSSSAIYQPGGKYTANADATLYAVWELAWIAPALTSPTCFRCNQNGVADDVGTYCRLTGTWKTDRTVKSIVATVNGVNTTISGSGTSGSIAITLGAGKLSAESSYTVTLVITDQVGSNTWTWTVAATHYILDFAPNGSVGIGVPADSSSKRFNSDIVNTTSTLWMAGSDGSNTTSGVAGYDRVLKITINSPYMNKPMRFDIASRSHPTLTLELQFASSRSTTPNIYRYLILGDYSGAAAPDIFYTYSKSVFEVYMLKSEDWDSPRVIQVEYDPYYVGTGLSFDYTQVHLTSKPSNAVNIPCRNSSFIPGSGLTLSDGTLSVNTNNSNEKWQSKNSYIYFIFTTVGKLCTAHFYGYRSDNLGWFGETSGSYWGNSIGMIPKKYFPKNEVSKTGIAFSRYWDGIACIQFMIKTDGNVLISSNSIGGYANTFYDAITYPLA